MHFTRRRFSSAAAAPFGGFVEKSTQRPPARELCPTRVEDDMSSDATVLCQDSEAEDELQSFLYEHNAPSLEAQLREQQLQARPYCTRGGNVPLGFESFSPANCIPVQRQTMMTGGRPPAEALQRELFRPRRGPALSWGFQQEMADYEALQEGIRGVGGLMYPPQPSGYVIRNDLQPLSVKQPRRSRVGKRDQMREGQNEDTRMSHVHGHVVEVTGAQNTGQQKRPKGRRRGRRGGRGRKNSERPSDDLPKLEQNLEDELAKEMANHISNKSALAQSFSSLRLHVAGGGTMIILNDKEITTAQQPAMELRAKRCATSEGPPFQSNLYNSYEEKSTHEVEIVHGADDGPVVARPKGCGAFFPPQVLQQVHADIPSSNQDPSLVSHPSTPSSALNVKATPYTPSESTQSVDKLVQQQSRGKVGTGCFIPAYSQDAASPTIDPSHVLESVSLVESLACLGNSDGLLNSSPEAQSGECELFDAAELCCSDVSTPIMDKPMKGTRAAEDVSQLGSSSQDPGNDLIQLIEDDDYTTFTSPLHLEDTLDGLQAEREAREETEQKLINLQIENEELRSSVRCNAQLEAKLQEMKAHNAVLQMMLFLELNKDRKQNLQRRTPLGLSAPVRRDSMPDERAHQDENKIGKSVKASKDEDQVNTLDPAKIKRSKSSMKTVAVQKPAEVKKGTKQEKRVPLAKAVDAKKLGGAGSKECESRPHVHLKSATVSSGNKKHSPRCQSRNRSVGDLGADLRKNKKGTMKSIIQHSRAASSSYALRS